MSFVYTLSFRQDMEKKMVPEADPRKPLERSIENNGAVLVLLLLVSPALLSFLKKP